LGWVEAAVGIGFLGLLAAAVISYFQQFPELLHGGDVKRLKVETIHN
jgi:hypothetical protein